MSTLWGVQAYVIITLPKSCSQHEVPSVLEESCSVGGRRGGGGAAAAEGEGSTGGGCIKQMLLPVETLHLNSIWREVKSRLN